MRSKKHVFLSYCHDNKDDAGKLRNDLTAAGFEVWWDRLIEGGDWEQHIRDAMNSAYAVVVCLSRELDQRRESGVWREIDLAIDINSKLKSGTAFILPIRLSDCPLPDIKISTLKNFDSLQCEDLFPAEKREISLKKLIGSLTSAAKAVGVEVNAPRKTSTEPPRKKVFLSSLLPQQFSGEKDREQFQDACLRMDCLPIEPEVERPFDDVTLQAWLRSLDDADFYLGFFAQQYGKVIAGNQSTERSLIEWEYDRAAQRGLKRFVFWLNEDVPVSPKEVDKGAGAERLQRFKDRIVSDGCLVAEFTDVADLRAKIVAALQSFREPQPAAFHYVSDIPAPPEVYVAHPYVLLKTGRVIGRQVELNWLTRWVADSNSDAFRSRMFFLVAIGGQGKSALTWDWFQHIAPQEMPGLRGRMWWSFYESDATFENFVIRALAYVSQQPVEDVRKLTADQREEKLLRVLNTEPHLLVLDGLERELIAYSGANCSRLQDDELDQQTANYVAQSYGLAPEAAQSFTGQHRLRLTVDPRVGAFLRKLTQVKAARVLVSTRLYPSDLQMANGEPVASCFAYFLKGLSDDDALNLWRSFGATGSSASLLPMLATFDKHPLLIQALASVVAHDRRAVGDFDKWRALHPDFDPFPLLHAIERKSHVLAHALRGLDDRQLRLLQTISAFRMPTTYDTLVAMFVKPEGAKPGETPTALDALSSGDEEDFWDEGDDHNLHSSHPSPVSHSSLQPTTFSSEPELDAALNTLEDRGLLGWDRRANRYDLHPIVRGVVWSGLDKSLRQSVCQSLHQHFAPIEVPDFENVESVNDLTPAIERVPHADRT